MPNATQAQTWIDKWRASVPQAAAGGAKAPAGKSAMLPNAMDAQAWITAWKAKNGKK
jgi:hypothetical protein